MAIRTLRVAAMSAALLFGVACQPEACSEQHPVDGRADNGLVYDGDPAPSSAPYRCEVRRHGRTLVTISVQAWSPEGAVAEVHRRHPWARSYEVVCGSSHGPSCEDPEPPPSPRPGPAEPDPPIVHPAPDEFASVT